MVIGQLVSRDDLLKLPVSERIVFQGSHYFHQDGLGSVVNLTNGEGNVKLNYHYDVFGEITKEEGSIGWKGNRYTFTGKPYDPAVGMFYFGARWYEAEVGRFGSKDRWTWKPDDERIINNLHIPIYFLGKVSTPFDKFQLLSGQIGSYPSLSHQYIYCLNNPINLTDPDGKASAWIPIFIQDVLYVIIGWIGYKKFENFCKDAVDPGESLYIYLGESEPVPRIKVPVYIRLSKDKNGKFNMGIWSDNPLVL